MCASDARSPSGERRALPPRTPPWCSHRAPRAALSLCGRASLFLEHRCQSPSRAPATKLAWCHIEPIVAVGTADHAINFYLDEGLLLDKCTIQRSCQVEQMEWQPRTRVVATGWADG